MASFNGKDVEKAKLQLELEYYTSLVSRHEKLQQTSNILAKDNKRKVFVKPFQTGNFSGSQKFPAVYKFDPKPPLSTVKTYKRTVIKNEISNPLPKRLVVAPTSSEKKRNSPFTTSVDKVNSIQLRTVVYNTKKVVPNAAVNASNTSVLLPEVTFKRTNGSLSKPHINSSKKSNELGKVLAETKKNFMRAASKKHIEELKALTKQLEQKNKIITLTKNRNSSISPSKNCDALVNPILSNANKSPLQKTNLNCQIKPELILKTNSEGLVKDNLISKSDFKMTKISCLETINPSKNDKPTLSQQGIINAGTPVVNSIKGHQSFRKKLSLPSSQKSAIQERDTLLQLVKNEKLIKTSCASIRLNTLSQLKTDVARLSALGDMNLKTPINSPLIKAKCVLKKKLSISSQQISKISKESLTKLINSQKPLTNSVSKPTVQKVITPKPNSMKKRGNMTKLIASKYKVVNKRISPSVPKRNRLSEMSIIRGNNLLSANKKTLPKFVKIQKNVQSSCALKPSQKVNSIKKQGNMRKLVASKYKVVNKRISNLPAVSGKNRFSKNQEEAVPNSFSKWPHHATSKVTSSIKRLNSSYTLLNLVKTPKRINSSLLKSPSPKFVKKGRYALKRRKLDASIPVNAQKLKNTQHPVTPQFKHTKMNYLVGSKRSTKLNLSMKSSSCSSLKTKYKVIHRRGLFKKSPKGSSPKSGAVLRTNSGVDIDLLIELAAEKESAENERVDSLGKKSVLSKRVYKSKNTIVNRNVSSVIGAKMARMIKTKYLLNKNVWQKQAISRKFIGNKYYRGHRFIDGFQRTPASQFSNPKTRRNYFKFPVQTYNHKLLRSYKASNHYVKTNKKIFTYRNYSRIHQYHGNSTPISKVLANRVLHQSINRVITATAKKKLSKFNSYCMFYNRFGRCNKGIKCTYVHDPSKIAVCTRFLRGTCKNNNCLFSHEINPGKMAICSFFLLGSCMKSDCPYRHETLSPNAELCKAFVQGYCPDGKQCKKAHVLVCPHFIQGCCEKGDTCAFPHPPPKEKKMLPKLIQQKETHMEVEDLMERVSRYFQPSNEESIGTKETTVVPKRQKLPEQPSFIAL